MANLRWSPSAPGRIWRVGIHLWCHEVLVTAWIEAGQRAATGRFNRVEDVRSPRGRARGRHVPEAWCREPLAAYETAERRYHAPCQPAVPSSATTAQQGRPATATIGLRVQICGSPAGSG